jgi:hypothetical protein
LCQLRSKDTIVGSPNSSSTSVRHQHRPNSLCPSSSPQWHYILLM